MTKTIQATRALLFSLGIATCISVSSPFANVAWAIPALSPGNLSGLSNTLVYQIIQLAGIGTGIKPYQPASSLGLVIGLDLGVEATAFQLTQAQQTALQSATQTTAPQLLAAPTFNLRKGLPFGIDFGVTYVSWGPELRIWGGDIQYSPKLPSPIDFAARLTYANSTLWFIQTSTWGVEVLASKNLGIIEPYLGLGLQFWSGTLINLPAGALALVPGVSASQSDTNPFFYVGLPIKLTVFHITPEFSYSFMGMSMFGAKVSLSL